MKAWNVEEVEGLTPTTAEQALDLLKKENEDKLRGVLRVRLRRDPAMFIDRTIRNAAEEILQRPIGEREISSRIRSMEKINGKLIRF